MCFIRECVGSCSNYVILSIKLSSSTKRLSPLNCKFDLSAPIRDAIHRTWLRLLAA